MEGVFRGYGESKFNVCANKEKSWLLRILMRYLRYAELLCCPNRLEGL